MNKLIRNFIAVTCLAFVFAACNINDKNTTTPNGSFFLMTHVSPDAPHLDIYINNEAFDTGLAYGIYTPYISAASGAYNFAVMPAGSTTPVITDVINFEPGKDYSYFIIDSFASIKSALVEDKLTQTSNDSCFIRFLNFSPNVGTVDFVDATDSATTLFSSRSFNDQANNTAAQQFTRIKSGQYKLQLRQTGSTTALATFDSSLVAGYNYTFFAKGLKDSSGTKALGIGVIQNYP